MSDHRNPDPADPWGHQAPLREAGFRPIRSNMIDECLAAFPDGDPRQKLLYKITARSSWRNR